MGSNGMETKKLSAESPRPGGRDSDGSVLVVDDDAKIVRVTGLSLKLAGYVVKTATNGEEALNLLESENADIMVLDIRMPVMDGFEVLRRLRAVSDLPVIACSAQSSAAEEAARLGANAFLAKPFRPDQLVESIEAILSHRDGQSG